MRIKELDFLRGIAVLLVFCCHVFLTDFLKKVGYTGVELFFVLSGFLISDLLFKEYQVTKSIKPIKFLIRRGIKIYPLFYFFILITVLIKYIFQDSFFMSGTMSLKNCLAEVFFVQNYFEGIWFHTWSLGVEEQFYFFVALLFFALYKAKLLERRAFFEWICVSVFLIAFVLRGIYWYTTTEYPFYNYSYTHLRMDGLFFGVILSYYYNFHSNQLRFFSNNALLILLVVLLCLSTAFFFKIESVFINTIGYSLLGIGYTLVLAVFLLNDKVKRVINAKYVKWLTNFISWIGVYSYSIYLWHLLGLRITEFLFDRWFLMDYVQGVELFLLLKFEFLFCLALTILMGVVTSKLIEIPFLKLRDRYFPKQSTI